MNTTRITSWTLIVGLMCVCVTMTSCTTLASKAKDWVIDKTTEIVDKKLGEQYDSKIAPQFTAVEEKIGAIDTDMDGIYSSEELASAIQAKIKSDVASGEGIDWKTILMLAVAYFASKFGVKFGPKGIQSIKTWKRNKDAEPDVDLN